MRLGSELGDETQTVPLPRMQQLVCHQQPAAAPTDLPADPRLHELNVIENLWV